MPSELTNQVRAAITNFVASKTTDDEHVAIDILRAIKEETSNLMERQLVVDTFVSDPLKIYEGDMQFKKQVERIMKLMNVISCSRCSTKDCYSTIEAVIEIRKDSKCFGVNNSVRLTFLFQRVKLLDGSVPTEAENKEKIKNSNTHMGQIANPTHITYSIDYSKDHGQKKPLIVVEVYAKTDHQSVKDAIPMDVPDDNSEDLDGVGKGEELGNDSNLNVVEDDTSMTSFTQPLCNHDDSDDNDNDDRDRYQAYADPDNIEDFLTYTGLNLNAENSVFFLMTFPFYEHEWDILGFLLNSVFGGGKSDSDEDSDDFVDMSDKDE